jgi:site-specific recombinase XerD
MTETSALGPWVRRFLLEHLTSERSLARNTQQSYRDTLRLLIPFVAERAGKAVDRLAVTDISPSVGYLFLTHLEEDRNCRVVTRNQRLAALHAFARFVGDRSPEHIEWCSQIRIIPFKRTATTLIPYLDKPEIEGILQVPKRDTSEGRRDYALLLFLYNSGFRADEAARLTVEGLDFTPTDWKRQAFVKICGKGGKMRQCPLWPVTVQALAPLIVDRPAHERVFLNRCRQPLTRFGIYALVKRYAQRAAVKMPSLKSKRISPHTIRHTTATLLLRSGVDINTIRAWLGHVSLSTTNIYTEIDLTTKAKALSKCEVTDSKKRSSKAWHKDRSLMEFLRKL